MALTEDEVMLLGMFAYISSGVTSAAGLDFNPEKMTSLRDLADAFDEEALRRLEENYKDDYISGAEWAAYIRAIKEDEALLNLDYEYNSKVFDY